MRPEEFSSFRKMVGWRGRKSPGKFVVAEKECVVIQYRNHQKLFAAKPGHPLNADHEPASAQYDSPRSTIKRAFPVKR
jgi:hypothetical protein